MNSKQRVQAALNRQPVDKIPLGFYIVDHDIVSHVIGRPTPVRNRIAMKLAMWEGRRDEMVKTWIADIIEFYEKIDCVDLISHKDAPMMPPKGYIDPEAAKPVGDNSYVDSKGRVWKAAPESNSIKIIEDKNAQEHPHDFSVEEFRDRTPPTPPDESCFEIMDALIRRFGSEKYIAGDSGGFVAMSLLGGFENGLMLMAENPDIVEAHNQQAVFRSNIMDAYRIRQGVDGVLIEQDMGGSEAPFISPRMFKRLCFPYMKERIQNIKKRVPKVILHNCGNNLPLMDMFLDAGIDAYESIQTNTEMSVETLIGRYGNRLTVWGAVSLDALNLGTTDEVRQDVRRCMAVGKKAPGFILGPSHSIAFGTKYDNFRAMLDEYVKLRDMS